jgi:PAS domain S-box-containing protein
VFFLWLGGESTLFQKIDFSVNKEDLFCNAMTSMPQSVWILDDDLRIVYTNKISEEIIGRQNVVGKFIWDILPGCKSEDVLQKFDQAQETKKVITLKEHHEALNGIHTWWNVSINSIQDSQNNRFYLMLIFQDVTEFVKLQKQVERAQKLEKVFQNVGGPMALYDQTGGIIFSNLAYSDLFEEEHDNLNGNPGSVLHRLKALERTFEFYDFKGRKIELDQLPIQNVVEGKQVSNYELKLFHKKQKKATYYLCNTSVFDTDVDEAVTVLIMTDVSKELGNEQKRRNFIQIAAHELRTPLTSIKGFTQLVLERYKEREKKWFFQPTMNLVQEIERDQTFFKVILDEAVRLDDLTNELLSIFRIDEGKFEMDLQPYKFSLIVQEAIQEFMIPNDFHSIQYLDLTKSDINILVDKKQIKRVIHNLLSNAIKYSPCQEKVLVTLESRKGYSKLSVKDQGIGIPIEQQGKIFQRFFRAHSAEHEGIHGFGVGLHICDEIVRQHKGQMSFKSRFGKGSTFYFQLPEQN